MKKYKKYILLDVDDTISDFCGNLLQLHNNLYGTNLDRSVFSNWSMPEDIRKTFKDYEYELYISQPVLPKVIHKLKYFRRKNYGIILMTARDESFRKATLFNLALNKIDYDIIFFNKNKSLKINKIMKSFNIKIFADDKIETVNKVAAHTKVSNIYLITRAYNRNIKEHQRVKRIYSISDIKE